MTVIRPDDIEFFRRLVLERSAITLDSNQDYLIESRLLPLCREHGAADVPTLLARLRGTPYGAVHRQAVEAMTTNETTFFRDPHVFEALRKVLLPALIARRAQDKRLVIWSAACSSGQEPYSILMFLLDEFPELHKAGWRLHLLASDLSSNMIERARGGTYNSLEVGRGLPAARRLQHFEPHGPHWQVREPLRRAISWFQLNLAAAWRPLPRVDLLFLRNVLIYFAPATRAAILERARRTLEPDGFLLLGTTETTHGLAPGLVPETCDSTIYYRRADAPVAPVVTSAERK